MIQTETLSAVSTQDGDLKGRRYLVNLLALLLVWASGVRGFRSGVGSYVPRQEADILENLASLGICEDELAERLQIFSGLIAFLFGLVFVRG